jgi:6-pyruvoyltetrahydropterin/6-carboxytetrahydropterin synthase
MERWAIQIDKEYLKYSAAHFLIFPDGSAERLHGHNYRVFCEVGGPLSEFGLVLDFQKTKPLIRALVDHLDEHWLIPGEHRELTWNEREDGVVEVRYRERYYAAPKEDVRILPINNTSVENMAAWLGRQLKASIEQHFPEVVIDEIMLAVEESPGQRGVWRLRANG